MYLFLYNSETYENSNVIVYLLPKRAANNSIHLNLFNNKNSERHVKIAR